MFRYHIIPRPRKAPSQLQLQAAQIRCITGTFIITLKGDFLPIKGIYGGKMAKSLPRFKFCKSFSLSVNPKHSSNTEESIKVIEEIVLPHVDKQHRKLDNHNQAALLILDVFGGQMTQEATTLLCEKNIYFVTIPKNMTHLFQPLNLTVNSFCKSFMKRKFAEWFTQQFDHQLTVGKTVEQIEIKFNLTEMKPIHTKWITEFYNHMSTKDGSKVIINGIKQSGILSQINHRWLFSFACDQPIPRYCSHVNQ